MMPGIDGWQTCRRLKSQPETADIPVIFVTAKDRYEDLSKGFEVGGVDYLTKPFEPIELAARVRSAIFTKRLQDELRKTAGDLKRMEQSRKELIGMLGHDIRNLANSVVAFMQLVRMGQLKPGRSEFDELLRLSESNISELLRMVNALLDVYKMEEGKLEAIPQAIALSVLGERSMAQVAPEALAKGIRLESTLPPDVNVFVDDGLIVRVLTNLLANAVKHTPSGGTVSVESARDRTLERSIIIRVRDTGPGINADDAPHIFDRFYQGAGRSRGGTGPGPACCQLAVSAMIFFFVDRVRRRTLLLWYVAGVTLLSVAIQGGVWIQGQLDYGWIVQPISYVFAHGVKETIYILFWVYAGNLYDAEQSKRLFPFFAGSVLVGKILGGAIGAGIAPLIHAENFIGAQAVGFMVCFLALVVYRGLPEGHGSRLAEERSKGIGASLKDSVEGYRAVASDKMLRTFGVGVFFWYFLMQFGNFLYLVGLDQSTAGSGTGSEDLFSQLYASVYTSSSLVALFIQSVFTGALLRRFGIARVLFVLPLWFLGSYAAATFTFNIITALAIQLSERIVIPAIP